MAEHQISLVDGGTLVAAEDEWPALATSSFGTLRGGEYLIARLAVRRHQDGRTLVHLEQQVGGKSKHTGALLPETTLAEVKNTARALVGGRDLPASLVEECVAALAAG